MKKTSILPIIFIIITSLLSACVSHSGYNNKQTSWEKRPIKENTQTKPNDLSVASVEKKPLGEENKNNINTPSVKVAILLPLSGEHEKLGQAMLNAAQMALFDIAPSNFILIPKDTKATAAGARTAAKSAIKDGASLIIGPIFSHSVKAASQITQKANVNMIAFSTNWQLANSNTFLISFLPFDQVKRIINYARNSGYDNIGILKPNNRYGDAVISAYNSISTKPAVIELFNPNGSDLNFAIRKFTNYDVRKAEQEETGNLLPPPFDAVLLPVGGTIARQVGSFLDHYDVPAHNIKRLGTGLMDDEILATDKSLEGTWFAAPSPQSYKKFERRYNSIFYKNPPRIASLAYDATALAAMLTRIGFKNGNQPAFDKKSITNPSGFNGIDGIFRFHTNGIIERGLAVLEYKKGKIVVIDQAPKTFQRDVF